MYGCGHVQVGFLEVVRSGVTVPCKITKCYETMFYLKSLNTNRPRISNKPIVHHKLGELGRVLSNVRAADFTNAGLLFSYGFVFLSSFYMAVGLAMGYIRKSHFHQKA